MIDRTYLFFPLLAGLVNSFIAFNSHAAQKATVSLPITMTVTNPQCQINNGIGLPQTVKLPPITTSGTLLGDNNVEIPIVIDCGTSNITRFEVTLNGGNNSQLSTSNNMVDITLSWKKGGGGVEFGTPIELSKAPFLTSQFNGPFLISQQYDGTLLARVSPHSGTIPGGDYTASLSVTFIYY